MDATAHQCLIFEKRPGTPEEIRRFRKSANLQPGKRFLHPGLQVDYKTMDLGSRTFGKTSDEPTSAGDLLSHNKFSEYEKLKTLKAEKSYKQMAKEPLGMSRLAVQSELPETHRNIAFGLASKSSLEPAKAIIFPQVPEGLSEAEKIYVKTHGSWGPGEQKRRGYDWTKTSINPEETRFGIKGDTIAFNGVSKNIDQVLKNENAQGDIYYQKNVENYREMGDILGRSKNLGQGSAQRPFDMVYGKPSAAALKAKGAWSAGQVLNGTYSLEQQLPDVDLGKSITPGFRNMTSETRAYGCPSIRTDYEPPARRSLADSQNYGDDVSSKDLINPPAFSDMIIDSTAMFGPRSPENIRNMFSKIGYELSDEDFAMVYSACPKNDDGYSSLAGFRDVLNEFLAMKDQEQA